MSPIRSEQSTRPGPRRPQGSPVGPDAVRRAVIDTAGDLFARNGIAQTSLRDIASGADVNVALISRYVGQRDDVIAAVLDDLGAQVGQFALDHPLQQQGWDADTPMGRWARIVGQLAVDSPELLRSGEFNPVTALAEVACSGFGLDDSDAKIRGAQIVASAIGWRLLEDYLLDCISPTERSRGELREALTEAHRRLGATPLD